MNAQRCLLAVVLFLLAFVTASWEARAPASSGASASTAEVRRFNSLKAAITCVALTGDGKTALGAGKDGTLCLWSTDTGQELQRLQGQTGEITSAALSPDGRRVTAGYKDGAIFVWDAETGKQLHQLPGHRDAVACLAFLSDGRRLISGSGGVDHSMRTWDLTSAKQTNQSAFSKKGLVYALAFSADGRWALTGHASDVKLWDSGGKEVAKFEGHTTRVLAAAFARDGKTGASASKDKSVRVWDLYRKRELRVLEGHKDVVTSIAFSPDGRLLVSGSGDKTVRIWEVSTGKQVLVLEGHSNDVTDVSFAGDGKKVLSGSADKTVRLWAVTK